MFRCRNPLLMHWALAFGVKICQTHEVLTAVHSFVFLTLVLDSLISLLQFRFSFCPVVGVIKWVHKRTGPFRHHIKRIDRNKDFGLFPLLCRFPKAVHSRLCFKLYPIFPTSLLHHFVVRRVWTTLWGTCGHLIHTDSNCRIYDVHQLNIRSPGWSLIRALLQPIDICTNVRANTC